jgi:two-component system phosphate regulon response regulator PhoB
VKAVLARAKTGEKVGEKIIRHGPLVIDLDQHDATVNGRTLPLTATEFRLLYRLASQPGHVQSRDDLLDLVWGEDKFVTPRAVDTYIRRLRAKLGPVGDMIETLRGVGYRFRKMSEK